MISVSSIHWGSKAKKDDCAVQIFLEALAEVVLCLGYVCKCARVCVWFFIVSAFSRVFYAGNVFDILASRHYIVTIKYIRDLPLIPFFTAPSKSTSSSNSPVLVRIHQAIYTIPHCEQR